VGIFPKSFRILANEMTFRERIERYVDAMPPAVSGEHGHTATFLVAIALVHGFDLSPDVALQFLRRYNERCQPPWNERELRHKLVTADEVSPRNGKARGYLL
jgi:hypothetical protein